MIRDSNGDTVLRDQPVSELVKQLTEQTKTLARQEVELARVELAEKGREAGLGAGMFGGAGLFGFFAFAALTMAAGLAIATALAGWLAALIVGAAYALIAGILALNGRRHIKKTAPAIPQQTVDTVKEDVQWARQRAQAGRQ